MDSDETVEAILADEIPQEDYQFEPNYEYGFFQVLIPIMDPADEHQHLVPNPIQAPKQITFFDCKCSKTVNPFPMDGSNVIFLIIYSSGKYD